MPSVDASDTQGISYYHIPSFTFANGETLPIKVAYRSFNPSASKTVLIPTCYGGRINSTLNFTTGCLSTYHVIVAASLGNGESSSPSSNPLFPPHHTLRYEDTVKAHHALLTAHLGLTSLTAVLGFSMGGQQAYYWAVLHGSAPAPFVHNSVVICGSARTSGHNYAFLEGPIGALTASADYAGGGYRARGVVPTQGLRAFGKAYAAWLTSAAWFRAELWRELGSESLRAWLEPEDGRGSYESWDAEDLLCMARCWQAGDVGSVGGEGGWRVKLGRVEARVLVMPSKTDQYFDWKDGEEEMKYLKKGTFAPIETVWGHIAGGGANEVDTKWMNGQIGEFLKGDDA